MKLLRRALAEAIRLACVFFALVMAMAFVSAAEGGMSVLSAVLIIFAAVIVINSALGILTKLRNKEDGAHGKN